MTDDDDDGDEMGFQTPFKNDDDDMMTMIMT